MRRHGGRPYFTDLSIVPKVVNSYDVYGYYKLLGLDPKARCNRSEIREAFKRAYSPLEPNLEIVRAYLTLSDSRKRLAYDQMSPIEIAPEKLAKILELSPIKVTPNEIKPVYDAFTYYTDDDFLVSQTLVSEWCHRMALCFHRLGIREDVRVGFTQNDYPYVRRFGWGSVYFVPRSRAPDIQLAAYLISTDRNPQRWFVEYSQILYLHNNS